MKSFLLDMVKLCLAVFLGLFFFPWYFLVVLTLIYGALRALSWKAAFFIPFLAVFLVWAVYPLVISLQDDFRMANVIGDVFGGLPAFAILLVNGLVFGFLGGMASLSGYFIRNLF